jgi:hypothetical protein
MAGLSVGGPSRACSGDHSWGVDYREFEQGWGESKDSPVAIEQQRASLRTQIARERHEVDEIADLVASRRDIAKGILARMNREIVARSGEAIWDSSDFVETSGEEGSDSDGSGGAVSEDGMFSDGGAAMKDVEEEPRDVDASGMAGEGSQGV